MIAILFFGLDIDSVGEKLNQVKVTYKRESKVVVVVVNIECGRIKFYDVIFNRFSS